MKTLRGASCCPGVAFATPCHPIATGMLRSSSNLKFIYTFSGCKFLLHEGSYVRDFTQGRSEREV